MLRFPLASLPTAEISHLSRGTLSPCEVIKHTLVDGVPGGCAIRVVRGVGVTTSRSDKQENTKALLHLCTSAVEDRT